MQVIPDGEAEAVEGLGEQVRAIQDKTTADYGAAVQGIHAKGHTIVSGMLEVLSGLPPELSQGLFASAGSRGAGASDPQRWQQGCRRGRSPALAAGVPARAIPVN